FPDERCDGLGRWRSDEWANGATARAIEGCILLAERVLSDLLRSSRGLDTGAGLHTARQNHCRLCVDRLVGELRENQTGHPGFTKGSNLPVVDDWTVVHFRPAFTDMEGRCFFPHSRFLQGSSGLGAHVSAGD